MSNSRVSTWSGIRNKLENDYLCPTLRGHIQYFVTRYSKSADHEGRAAIRMDGVEVLRSNHYTYFENVWTKFHHLRSKRAKIRTRGFSLTRLFSMLWLSKSPNAS